MKINKCWFGWYHDQYQTIRGKHLNYQYSQGKCPPKRKSTMPDFQRWVWFEAVWLAHRNMFVGDKSYSCYHFYLLQGRIKKIMQTDEEVGKVAQAVPIIIYILFKWCNLFLIKCNIYIFSINFP